MLYSTLILFKSSILDQVLQPLLNTLQHLNYKNNICVVVADIDNYYCLKSNRIRSSSGPHFPTFGQEKLHIRTLFTQCIGPIMEL